MQYMSSIESRYAPVISNRRVEITGIDEQLQWLNQIFPDERKKPDRFKDPEYLAQRTPLLDRKRLLQGRQKQDRRTLRQS